MPSFGVESFVFELLSTNLKIKIYENRVLRRIFGPKRDKLTGEW